VQAEDGIRDFHVTGVQTCALPISPGPVLPRPGHRLGIAAVEQVDDPFVTRHVGYPGAIDEEPNRRPVRIVRRRGKPDGLPVGIRSEERRVGNGWRWTWSAS